MTVVLFVGLAVSAVWSWYGWHLAARDARHLRFENDRLTEQNDRLRADVKAERHRVEVYQRCELGALSEVARLRARIESDDEAIRRALAAHVRQEDTASGQVRQ